MKVIITLEDTTRGIFPVVKWYDNGVTDSIETSISLVMAAQFAELIRQSSKIGGLKVVDSPDAMH